MSMLNVSEVSKVEGLLEDLRIATDTLNRETANSEKRFEIMVEILERHERERAVQFEKHVAQLEHHERERAAQFEKHVAQLDSHASKLDGHEQRFDKIVQRLERDHAAQLENHGAQLDDHKQSFDDMKSSIDMLHEQWAKKWASAEKETEKAFESAKQKVHEQDPLFESGADGDFDKEDRPEEDSQTCKEAQHPVRKKINLLRSDSGLSEPKARAAQTKWIHSRLSARQRCIGRRPRSTLIRMVDNESFNAACSFLIVVNTIVIGIQTNIDMDHAFKPGHKIDQPGWFRPLNLVLMILFTIELCFRLVAERLHFFLGDNFLWNLFDGVMVITSLLEEIFSSMSGNVSFFRVIRIVKMGRAIRIFRVFRYSRELRIMLCSIASSFVSLAWAFVLMIIMIYCSSVLLCQGIVAYLVYEDPHPLLDWRSRFPGYAQRDSHPLFEFYGTIARAMYSHILAISGGMDWYSLCDFLQDVGPFYVGMFVFYILFVVFGMLNVLTGVFVDRAAELSNLDRDLIVEAEKRKVRDIARELQAIFDEADLDGSGIITYPEFKTYCEREDVVAFLQSLEIDTSEIHELFHTLDLSKAGHVNIEDFIRGCLRVKGAAKGLDLLHIQEELLHVKQLLMLIGEDLTAVGTL